MSSIVNVAVELKFPQSSVAVNVTMAEPVAPQSSLKPAKSLLQVTRAHVRSRGAAVIVQPCVQGIHVAHAVALTVWSEAMVISGDMVSSMVKVAVVLLALSQSSVAVKITVTEPVAPQSSLNAKSLLHSMLLQLSVAEAPPLLSNHASNAAMLPMPSHSTVWSAACMSMTGAWSSTNVMICSAMLVLPQSSVAVYVRR